ncbi:MAG: LuxR C-terminal-related transcriptional regulator [Anaerolineae bacterium]
MQPKYNFIQTKLHIPVMRSASVPRPDLFRLLDASYKYTLILVSAPAGYGKTTLTAQWLAQQTALEAVWVSLDAEDNDPIRFFQHLVAGLQNIMPETSATLQELLISPQPPDTNTIVGTLLNTLASVERDIVIVLDDYHVIEQRALHEAVQRLIDRASPNLHLLMTTRADPPLPLARFRARNQVLEIRAEHLRFTSSDTRTFFELTTGINLTTEQTSQITTKTEGWIAALQLVALSVQGVDDVARFVENLSGVQRYIVDYLVDEVLSRQPEDMQDFLMQTAILSRMCGDLCDALTGREDSQDILETLERANLFVIALDDERQWYRYHHLFAQFLQSRLSKSAKIEAHLRAAAWYSEAGLLPEAINHALLGGDFVRMGHLLARSFKPMLASGATATLEHWYRALPEAVLHPHPDWQISFALTLAMSSKYEECEQHLLHAEARLDLIPAEQRGAWQGWAATLHALIASWHLQPDETLAWAERAFALLPPDEHFARATVHFARGQVLNEICDLPEEAIRAFEMAVESALKTSQFTLAAYSLSYAATIDRTCGRLSSALARLEYALRLLKADDHLSVAAIVIYESLALTILEHYEVERALAIFTPQLVDYVERSGLTNLRMTTRATRANLLVQLNQADEARRLNAEAIQMAEQLGDDLTIRAMKAMRAAYHIYEDDAEVQAEALTWSRDYESRLSFEERTQRRDYLFDSLMFTAILLVQKRYAEMRALVLPMAAVARKAERYGHLLELLITLAYAEYHLGNLEAAKEAMRASLVYAAPERFIRPYLNLGPEVGIVLGYLLPEADPQTAAFIRQIHAYMHSQSPTTEAIALPTSDLIEPLTERELDVLRLMDIGLTNQEIADRLVIALGTAKKHISNIFLKLGAQNRTQALSKAREYDLL